MGNLPPVLTRWQVYFKGVFLTPLKKKKWIQRTLGKASDLGASAHGACFLTMVFDFQ